MRQGGTISGRIVTSAGQPAARYCVQAFDAATESFALAFTDHTGRYTIRGLSSGSIRCSSPAVWLRRVTHASWLGSLVAPRAVTGIDERTPAGRCLSGKVLAGARRLTPSGHCVLILPVQHSGGFGFINSAANGRYRVTGLAPAVIRCPSVIPLRFPRRPESGAPVVRRRADPGRCGSGHRDRSRPDRGSRRDAEGKRRISGLVTDDANAPVPGECVIAFPLSAMPDPFLGEVQQPEIAVTGNNGSYTLAGMQPGRYKVKFTTGCGSSGFATQWWDHVASAPAATVITVGAGAKVQGSTPRCAANTGPAVRCTCGLTASSSGTRRARAG